MAQTGTVRVQSTLNLRSTPEGATIASLPNGTIVEILARRDGWYEVQAGGKRGFVSSDFVVVDDGSGQGFRFEGTTAIAPDGRVFGKKFRKGLYNVGTTTLHEFVAANGAQFPDLAPSLLRVMNAVSANEGRLEAINTWDTAFLTFGAFQWTAGADDGLGELPGLLDRLQSEAPEVYTSYFGQYGLDVVDIKAGAVPGGRFRLHGKVLKTGPDKEVLRSLEWPYRFWLAGHDTSVRRVQVLHAAGRLGAFYRVASLKPRGFFVSELVTSEYGVALLLDQHVNRPGHVAKTVTAAVEAFANAGGKMEPAKWGFAEEKRLIELYLAERAKTSMTDQKQRAQRTLQAVSAGLASDQRGSFQMA